MGDKFNVTVWAGTAGDAYVYQAEVFFNVTQLQAVRAGYTGVSGSQWWKGHVSVPVALGIDNIKGTVVGGESLLGLDAVHASSGSLFWIEFQITTAPTPGNTLTSLIDTNDVSNSFLLDADLNQLNSVLDHATYTFSGPPPARHQVLVNSVTPSSGQVYQGSSMSIAVVVLNNGTVTETFDVNATYDGAVIGNQTVTSLVAGGTQTLTFIWNTVGVAAGNYTLTATATPVTGQTDLTSISKTANVAVLMSRHQVVVSSVSPSSANVTQGFSVSLSVLVLNNGTATETSVAVNATANGILIGQQTVPSLGAGNTTTLTFIWNTVGVSIGDYTVTATVTPVANQTDLVGISQSVTIHVLAMSVGQYYLTVTSLYDSPTPQSGWFNSGTNITESVTSPTSGGADIRNICTGWTGTGNVPASGTSSTVSFAITMNSTITWNWKTQYYLHVSSVYDSPSPLSGWFDSGSSITESVSSPVSDGSGVQHVCTGWTGSGSVPSSGFSLSFTFTINSASSVTWNWKTQYYLTVTSAYDSPSPVSGWFGSGSSITEPVTSPVSGGSGIQHVCTGWSGSGSVPVSGSGSFVTFTVSAVSSIAWSWKTQYQVKFDQSGVSPAFKGTVMAIDSVNYSEDNLPLSFWWDNGSSHSFSFVSPLAVASTEYVWNSTVGLSSLQSGTLTATDSGSIVGDYAARTSQPPQPAQPLLPPLLILLSAFGLALLGACVLSVFLGVFKKIQVGGRQQKGS